MLRTERDEILDLLSEMRDKVLYCELHEPTPPKPQMVLSERPEVVTKERLVAQRICSDLMEEKYIETSIDFVGVINCIEQSLYTLTRYGFLLVDDVILSED